jgi:hypothetical protein
MISFRTANRQARWLAWASLGLAAGWALVGALTALLTPG